jgi:hypothetical protein
MHTGREISNKSGEASALVLEFGDKPAKAKPNLSSACRLTIDNISFHGEGMLSVRGEVVSSRPLAGISIYVDQHLIGSRTFPPSNPEQFLSFNFECDGALDQTGAQEKNVKIVCTDVTGHKTSESRTFAFKRQPTAKPAGKLLQAGFIADALVSAFDPEYYAREYPDVKTEPSHLILHFIERGWFEGRNPNAFFDTVSYLLEHEDVAKATINPFLHYLTEGRREGRKVNPSISPSVRTQLLFGYEIKNWVERLRPVLDMENYRRQFPDRVPANVDLVAHFAYRGWREGRSPNTSFNTPQWLDKYPASSRYLVNPVLIQLESERGTFDLHLLTNSPSSDASPSTPDPVGSRTLTEEISEHCAVSGFGADQIRLDVIQGEFSPSFYLAAYPDVAKAGVSPLEHFYYTGWRESRCPNQDFDTKYYLEVNEDVAKAEINPFWHYIVSGRAEGRLPRRPGGYRREIIDAAVDPSNIAYNGNELDVTPLSIAELVNWSRLSEQKFRVDKWSLCRG